MRKKVCQKKNRNTIALLFSILVAMYLTFFFMNIENNNPAIVEYNTEICVQWTNGVTRDLLIFECYDFINQNVTCDWFVDADDKLIIHAYQNPKDKLSVSSCLTYSPTRQVMINKGGGGVS